MCGCHRRRRPVDRRHGLLPATRTCPPRYPPAYLDVCRRDRSPDVESAPGLLCVSLGSGPYGASHACSAAVATKEMRRCLSCEIPHRNSLTAYRRGCVAVARSCLPRPVISCAPKARRRWRQSTIDQHQRASASDGRDWMRKSHHGRLQQNTNLHFGVQGKYISRVPAGARPPCVHNLRHNPFLLYRSGDVLNCSRISRGYLPPGGGRGSRGEAESEKSPGSARIRQGGVRQPMKTSMNKDC